MLHKNVKKLNLGFRNNKLEMKLLQKLSTMHNLEELFLYNIALEKNCSDIFNKIKSLKSLTLESENNDYNINNMVYIFTERMMNLERLCLKNILVSINFQFELWYL